MFISSKCFDIGSGDDSRGGAGSTAGGGPYGARRAAAQEALARRTGGPKAAAGCVARLEPSATHEAAAEGRFEMESTAENVVF